MVLLCEGADERLGSGAQTGSESGGTSRETWGILVRRKAGNAQKMGVLRHRKTARKILAGGEFPESGDLVNSQETKIPIFALCMKSQFLCEQQK